MLALSTTKTYCQEDTSLNDSLVYVPNYLMELMVSDLDQCDKDRIELRKIKAETSLMYVENAEKTATAKRLSNELAKQRMENDSLNTVIMELNIAASKQLKKDKRAKRFWFSTTIAGVLTAVGIHYDWKNGWTDKYR